MEKQPLISVIIPVYKAEKYLPTCLDSLLAQTYQNLEIILVNDGSPDNSGAICDAYAVKDRRFRVIHQENSGARAARNAGLDVASGAYIGFVDADDSLEPEMYQILFQRIQTAKADIAQCRHRSVSENGTLLFTHPEVGDMVLDRVEALKGLFTGLVQFVTWDKLYRAELFHCIRFDPRFPVCEDLLLNYTLLKKCNCIALTEKTCYTYVQYPFSLSNTYSKKYSAVAATRVILEDIHREYPDLEAYANQTLCNQLVGIYDEAHPLLDSRAKTDPAGCKKQRAWAVKELRQELRGFLANPVCQKKMKQKALLISLFPQLYPIILHWQRKIRGIAP